MVPEETSGQVSCLFWVAHETKIIKMPLVLAHRAPLYGDHAAFDPRWRLVNQCPLGKMAKPLGFGPRVSTSESWVGSYLTRPA
jgi:hypothetical protein